MYTRCDISNSGWYIGSTVAAWNAYGTNARLHSTLAWRIPIGLQAIASAIVLCTVWFLPETPRWLVSVRRRHDARIVLSRYHADNDINSPIVKLQMREIDDHISLDGSDKRWWDYRTLYSSRNARYRSFMVLTMAIFGQWYISPRHVNDKVWKRDCKSVVSEFPSNGGCI